MSDLNHSKASRRVAAELGNLTNHQQNIFSWVSEKYGWKPGSSWGNYSTPSGTLRDVQAVAKKGHLVQREDGTYVVPEAIKARIAEVTDELRAEDKARNAARMAAYAARRFVVVVLNVQTGKSRSHLTVFTGENGSKDAHAWVDYWKTTPAGQSGHEIATVVELPAL